MKALKMKMFYVVTFLMTSLSLLSVCEAGQSITVRLDHPSSYTNGDPLPEGEIIGYRVFYAVDGLADEGSPTLDVGPLKSFNINLNLEPREAPYTINVTAQTIGVSSVSDLSNRLLISRTIKFYVRVKPPVLKEIEMYCDSNCIILEDDGI